MVFGASCQEDFSTTCVLALEFIGVILYSVKVQCLQVQQKPYNIILFSINTYYIKAHHTNTAS